MAGRRIAILGATSHLAKDIIAILAEEPSIELTLFARRPEAVATWAAAAGLGGRFPVFGYEQFGRGSHDSIINFVGAGDPATVARMGGEIFSVTLRFDELALNYLRQHSNCRYLFLSSGAVYGGSFGRPADVATPSRLPINALLPSEFYAVAKLHAECRHRALAELPIIDIRVFNYFSRTLDLSSRYFIADVLRAIRERRVLETTIQPIVRDYLHARDFGALVGHLLMAAPANCAVDCYTLAPVEKRMLLSEMQTRFGLKYVIGRQLPACDGNSVKTNYYSLNRRAAEFGYQPKYSSIQCLVEEAAALLGFG